MTKLAELRQAFSQVTPGEWWYSGNLNADSYSVSASLTGGAFVADMRYANKANNATFITLAHNNMAALLEAVERLEAMQRVIGELASMNPFLRDVFDTNKAVLEKLK